MIDKRLLGKWKSDARKTLRELRLRGNLKPKQLKFLATVFGKLELRYTRTKCYSNFEGHLDSHAYTVIGKDSTSVAVLYDEPVMAASRIQHIRFEDQHYWIETGVFREWFKRID